MHDIDNFQDDGWIHLKNNISKMVDMAKSNRQDLPILVTGMEGSGKSTLAYHVCNMLDPNFNLSESIIFDFKESKHSFKNFMDKFADIPYKVAFLDEAITVLFSQFHATKETKDAQMLYKIKRDCRHFDLIVTPSFWDIVPDIRERRAKALIITYIEINNTPTKPQFRHKFAWYSRKKITSLVNNNKCKRAFGNPEQLFKLVSPNFSGYFPPLKQADEEAYLNLKRDNRQVILNKIFGESENRVDPILEPLDFSEFDQKQQKQQEKELLL